MTDERCTSDLLTVKKIHYLDFLKNHSAEICSKYSVTLDPTGIHSKNCYYLQATFSHPNEISNKEDIDHVQNYINSLYPNFEANIGEGSSDDDSSSYDSDYEGGGGDGEGGESSHDDVSRTTSDTLAAEFAEYVNVTATGQKNTTVAGYADRLEFAIKLGYTKELLDKAMQTLGPEPAQNDLLAELINLADQTEYSPGNAKDSTNVSSGNSSPVTSKITSNLRPIVVDGSNVAMSHGNNEIFSCRGIRICVEWFLQRGHSDITVFVPSWRKECPKSTNLIVDQDILRALEKQKLLVFTPSREVRGKRMTCYDDRYILKLAAQTDGIVVSNDTYRDLVKDSPEFQKVVEERILMYSFVNDRFMPPDDPMGRNGPTLDVFLRFDVGKGCCPYGKKCTYGVKCKYSHPERQAFNIRNHKSVKELERKSLSLPLQHHQEENLSLSVDKTPLSRARSSNMPEQDVPVQLNMTHSPSPHWTSQWNAQQMNALQMNTQQMNTQQMNAQQMNTLPLNAQHPNAHQFTTQQLNGQPPFPLQRLMPPRMYHQDGSLPGPSWQEPQYPHPPHQPVAHTQSHEPQRAHAKLERQYSINPVFDHRIFQARKMMMNDAATHASISRHFSYQEPHAQPFQGAHTNVSRIASAPPTNQFMQLYAPVNVMCQQQWAPQNGVQLPQVGQQDEARNKLRYHLCSLFPLDKVDAAMNLCPHETNPKNICAKILTMFPDSQT